MNFLRQSFRKLSYYRPTDRRTHRDHGTARPVTSSTVRLSRVFVSRESRAYFHVIKPSRFQPFHSRDVTSRPIEQMTFIILGEII